MGRIFTLFFTASALLMLSNIAVAGCPDGMAFIPVGEYLVGWDNGEPDERPERVDFTKPYCIDKYEYPNKPGVVPMANVSYIEAEKLCAAQGKRICTEREWERACRGPKGTVFTYGMKYEPGVCNLDSAERGDGAATQSAAMEKCANDYGVHDMTGNLWEWSAGVYSRETPWPIIKGGSFQRGPLFASCYARFTQPPDQSDNGTGFRCCAEPVRDKRQDFEDGASCIAPRPRLAIRKQIFALFRDPSVVDILYAEDKKLGTNNDAEARAVVFRQDKATVVIYRLNPGVTVSAERFSVPFDAARQEAASISEAVNNYTGVPSRQSCWSCEGVCTYTSSRGWSNDFTGAKDAIFKFLENDMTPEKK